MVKALEDNKIITNTSNGYVNSKGNLVGFKLTRHKKYIEDKYFNIAKNL